MKSLVGETATFADPISIEKAQKLTPEQPEELLFISFYHVIFIVIAIVILGPNSPYFLKLERGQITETLVPITACIQDFMVIIQKYKYIQEHVNHFLEKQHLSFKHSFLSHF